MAKHGETHWDVAAYALGVLDPADVAGCEAHLAECPGCAAELETLLPTSRLLADVDIESVRAAEQPSFVDKLLQRVRAERHRLRLRRRLVAATGTGVAAALAGFSLFAGSSWLAASPAPEIVVEPSPTATASPTPGAFPGLGGPDLGDGETFSVEDDTTGVQANVILDELDWGTRIWLSLSSVYGPLDECRLVLVHADGTTEPAGSWAVPQEGYGTPAWPDPLQMPAATYAGMDDLAELWVVAVDPADGSESRLVTVGF